MCTEEIPSKTGTSRVWGPQKCFRCTSVKQQDYIIVFHPRRGNCWNRYRKYIPVISRNELSYSNVANIIVTRHYPSVQAISNTRPSFEISVYNFVSNWWKVLFKHLRNLFQIKYPFSLHPLDRYNYPLIDISLYPQLKFGLEYEKEFSLNLFIATKISFDKKEAANVFIEE